MKEARKNTAVTPQILEEIKAVRKNTDVISQIKANTDAIPPVLGEIKGLRDDIPPGYANNLRQVQADFRATKERLGMQ